MSMERMGHGREEAAPAMGRRARGHTAAPAGTIPSSRPPGARAYERKKRRSRRVLFFESASPLNSFFTGGVEYDDRVDLAAVGRFIIDFERFLRTLEVSRGWGLGVELKFRRLGRHRADGLYYPEQSVIVLDISSTRSFAHEFGHLIDYGPGCGRLESEFHAPLSRRPAFEPVHALFVERIDARRAADPRLASRKGRLSRGYFASAAECFARGFEQFAAELLREPSVLAGDPVRYREDPLFLEAPPPFVSDYYRRALDGPCPGSEALLARPRPAALSPCRSSGQVARHRTCPDS